MGTYSFARVVTGFFMHKSQRSLIFDLSVFFGSIAVLSYFVWYGFYGPRSFDHAKVVKRLVQEQQKITANLESRKKSLNARVALLRPNSIDPDMLDEQARKRLEFANKADILIVKQPK